MSDDLVVKLFLGLATMFLGPVVVPMLGGRRGRVFSLLLSLCMFALAWDWPNLKGQLAFPLSAFLVGVASNGNVWMGMLVTTWLYVAADSLFAPYRETAPAQTKTSLLDSLINFVVPRLPESLANDREYLIKELASRRGRRAQIFYGPSDRCVRLANEFSEILKAAEWVQVTAPMLIPQGDKARRGFSIRSGTTDPAYDAGLALIVKLKTIGVNQMLWQTPRLQQFAF